MNTLNNIELFKNIDESKYQIIYKCLNGRMLNYEKGQVLKLDEKFKALVIFEGKIDLLSSDPKGNLTLHRRFKENETIIINFIDENKFLQAVGRTTILMLNLEMIFKDKSNNCPVKRAIMENIIRVQNELNLFLDSKSEIYIEKSLRNKILLYLNTLCDCKENKTVKVPFNREELSQFLACDRSALSRELSKMQKENLIRVDRNSFTLLI